MVFWKNRAWILRLIDLGQSLALPFVTDVIWTYVIIIYWSLQVPVKIILTESNTRHILISAVSPALETFFPENQLSSYSERASLITL